MFRARPRRRTVQPVPACLALCLAACTGAGEDSRWLVEDSAGIEVVTTLVAPGAWTVDPEPVLTLGSADAGGPTDFFRIRAITPLSGGGFVVANGGTDELRFFSSSGAFLRRVGRTGHGPGEFKGLYTAALVLDSLLTYDGGNDRFGIWTQDGEWVRSFRLEWFSGLLVPAAFASSGEIVSATARPMTHLEGVGLVLDSALISLYDREGNLIDSLARIPHNERVVRREGDLQTTVGAPFSPGARLIAGEGGFCYVFGSAPQVRCHDRTGALVRIAKLPFEPGTVTESDIDRFWAEEEAGTNEAYRRAVRRFRRDMPFPERFPAFDRFRRGGDGRWWLREYSPPGGDAGRWWVLKDGHAVATVALPAGFELLRPYGDLLYGVMRDLMDVEYVQILRFREAS